MIPISFSFMCALQFLNVYQRWTPLQVIQYSGDSPCTLQSHGTPLQDCYQLHFSKKKRKYMSKLLSFRVFYLLYYSFYKIPRPVWNAGWMVLCNKIQYRHSTLHYDPYCHAFHHQLASNHYGSLFCSSTFPGTFSNEGTFQGITFPT